MFQKRQDVVSAHDTHQQLQGLDYITHIKNGWMVSNRWWGYNIARFFYSCTVLRFIRTSPLTTPNWNYYHQTPHLKSSLCIRALFKPSNWSTKRRNWEESHRNWRTKRIWQELMITYIWLYWRLCIFGGQHDGICQHRLY